jgi:hypothetical protein
MGNNTDPADWWKNWAASWKSADPADWWKNWATGWKSADPADWWKNWATGWKDWVPDPAKIYVAGDSDLPIKVNPIFRGAQRQPTIETDLCSVIMPFGKKEIDGSEIDFDSVYNGFVKPAFENAGFRVLRSDTDIFRQGEYIIQEIWRLINRSRLIVADLTGRNPNVFYELGISHTVGRDVIILAQNEKDVPFDIQGLQHIKYSIDENGKQKLRGDLDNLLKDVKPRTS